MRHPSYWGGIPPNGGGLGEILPPGPFQGIHSRIPVARDQPKGCQSSGAIDSKPDSVHLGELYGLMCYNGTPGCRSLRLDRVQNWGTLHDPAVGPMGDLAPSCAGRTNRPGGFHGVIARIGFP